MGWLARRKARRALAGRTVSPSATILTGNDLSRHVSDPYGPAYDPAHVYYNPLLDPFNSLSPLYVWDTTSPDVTNVGADPNVGSDAVDCEPTSVPDTGVPADWCPPADTPADTTSTVDSTPDYSTYTPDPTPTPDPAPDYSTYVPDPAPSYDPPSYDSSPSYDSGGSYDSGSSFDSGSSGGDF